MLARALTAVTLTPGTRAGVTVVTNGNGQAGIDNHRNAVSLSQISNKHRKV